jgi:hypothetical protein
LLLSTANPTIQVDRTILRTFIVDGCKFLPISPVRLKPTRPEQNNGVDLASELKVYAQRIGVTLPSRRRHVKMAAISTAAAPSYDFFAPG